MATRVRPPVRVADSEQVRQAEANRVTASIAGLAAALLLVVLGLVLVHHLYDEGRVEDCLMAGRNNCEQFMTAR